MHPLNSKLAWLKLSIGIVVVVVGLITSFQITVNKTTVVSPAQANPASAPAIKRAYITEAQCRGIKKGDKLADLDDRFRSKSDHAIAWRFPLAEDQDRDCSVLDDYDDKVEVVTLDLVGF